MTITIDEALELLEKVKKEKDGDFPICMRYDS